jgi:hypothetical protein
MAVTLAIQVGTEAGVRVSARRRTAYKRYYGSPDLMVARGPRDA